MRKQPIRVPGVSGMGSWSEVQCWDYIEDLGYVKGPLNTITPLIKDFFDRYARSRSVQDIDLIASQYPDSFMVAGPNGAKVAQKISSKHCERPGVLPAQP